MRLITINSESQLSSNHDTDKEQLFKCATNETLFLKGQRVRNFPRAFQNSVFGDLTCDKSASYKR